ncbi:hypothetical protein GmHk_15G042612 [Glycine max]|nr:hypothetical protein GmHk_15G042612 [Glycine max]
MVRISPTSLNRGVLKTFIIVQVLNVSRIMRRCEWVYAYGWTQESPRATTAEMQARKRVNFELGLVSLLWGEGLRRVWSLR